MGELGDLLEVLHDAHAGVSTVQVEFREWIRQQPSLELGLVDPGDGRPALGWRGGGPWATNLVRTRRLWLERPDRLRVELIEGEMLVRLAIRAGQQWWRWDEAEGTTSGSLGPDNTGQPAIPQMLAAPLSAVHRLPAMVRLKPAGTGERAGRRVLRAQAQPRQPPPSRGEIRYELEFDAEHGTLLRHAEIEDGERVWEREALEVLYGVAIEPACFVFAPPDNDHARL